MGSGSTLKSWWSNNGCVFTFMLLSSSSLPEVALPLSHSPTPVWTLQSFGVAGLTSYLLNRVRPKKLTTIWEAPPFPNLWEDSPPPTLLNTPLCWMWTKKSRTPWPQDGSLDDKHQFCINMVLAFCDILHILYRENIQSAHRWCLSQWDAQAKKRWL